MQVLFVPLLVGIPVVIGGGFIIYKIVGGKRHGKRRGRKRRGRNGPNLSYSWNAGDDPNLVMIKSDDDPSW